MVVVDGGGKGRRTGKGGGRSAVAEDPQCLIGPGTDVKSSAGFVANMIREGRTPEVKAISAANVNRAVKTLALARSYLEEEKLDFYAQVDFPEFDERNSAMVTMHLFQKVKRTDLSHVNAHLSVSSSSSPGSVAGAICGNLREASLRRICVTAAGPPAVLCTLKAIHLSKTFMQEEGCHISVMPEFDHSEDGQVSLINFFVMSHDADSAL